MGNNNNIKKKRKKSRKVFKYLGLGFIFLILTVCVIGAGYVYAIIKSAPTLDVNSVLNLNQQSRIYDNKEQFMDNVQTDEERFVIPFEDMKQYLKDAFVSIEDERFYEHKGIDIKRIFGAVYIDLKKYITGKSGLHGASTLTQQLLKNTILTNDVTPERKITEMYLALKLEKYLNKNQILEAYLNTIPLGGQVYGVEAASLKFFGKSAKDLNLVQSAYIAGITQAPSYYSAFSPQNQKDPTPYKNRTKTVLSKMLENGKITQDEHDKAIADVNAGNFGFDTKKRTEKMNYEWFSRPVIQQVKNDLMKKYKYTSEEASKLLTNGGLKIYSTMDKTLQDYTMSILNDSKNFNLGNNKNEMIESQGYKYPALQAAATIMDYRTGEVKALVGGRGDQPPMSINRAFSISGLRPIGSGAKPLTVYSPAIDQKLLTPASVVDDAPWSPETGKKYSRDPNKPYMPQNQSRSFSGNVTLREALRYSLNVVAVKVEDFIGYKTGLSYGEKFGLIYNKNSKTSITAIALGQFNNAPNDKDGGNTTIMSAAYGTFGNSGIYTSPILYTRVEDATGKVILSNEVETKKILSPQSAYIMYDMLKEPVNNYTAKPAKFGKMPVAGKTGTTSDNKDLWFTGLTPYLSASVWIGYDNPRVILGESGYTVTPIWSKIMAKAHEGLEYKEIAVPSGLVRATVCKDSGKLPTDLCREDSRGNRLVEDWFIEGTQPSTFCDAHVTAKINKSNGKLANNNTPADLITERVFVKKPYDGYTTKVGDSAYMLPKEEDDTVAKPPTPEITNPINPSNNNSNNTNNQSNSQNNSTQNSGNTTDQYTDDEEGVD